MQGDQTSRGAVPETHCGIPRGSRNSASLAVARYLQQSPSLREEKTFLVSYRKKSYCPGKKGRDIHHPDSGSVASESRPALDLTGKWGGSQNHGVVTAARGEEMTAHEGNRLDILRVQVVRTVEAVWKHKTLEICQQPAKNPWAKPGEF